MTDIAPGHPGQEIHVYSDTELLLNLYAAAKDFPISRHDLSDGNLIPLTFNDLDVTEQAWVRHTVALINKWLARGDKACLYRNEDLGHRDLGRVTIVSYGSSGAQLEAAQFERPPSKLPDIGNAINWRYRLQGVYAGPSIELP